MPDSDLSAALDDIRKRWEVFGEASDLPRLLALADAAMKLADEWQQEAAELDDEAARVACNRCAGPSCRSARRAAITTPGTAWRLLPCPARRGRLVNQRFSGRTCRR